MSSKNSQGVTKDERYSLSFEVPAGELKGVLYAIWQARGVKLISIELDSPNNSLNPASPNENPPNQANAVRALLTAMATGRKIEAIREFRVLTGDGLKESLAAVDAVYKAAA
jgi:ribosomal protein L7/L12